MGHTTPMQTATWLRRRLGCHTSISCIELKMDGAALCSLSRDEWLSLSPSLAPGLLPSQLEGVWDQSIAPAAALATASPTHSIQALPEPADGEPFSVIVAGDTGTGKSTLLNSLVRHTACGLAQPSSPNCPARPVS